jgi:hypothetical protein
MGRRKKWVFDPEQYKERTGGLWEWGFLEGENGKQDNRIYVMSESKVLARLALQSPQSEERANAVLMADAPRLLEELQTALARIKELEDHLHHLRMDYGDMVQGI